MTVESTSDAGDERAPPRRELPMSQLLALFVAGFVAILTETLPAGLLPQMSAALHQPESLIGQTVTIYAIGSAVVAIPVNILLSNWGRRGVLMLALTGLLLGNLVTALSPDFALTMAARLVAGFAAGLIWSNLGVYAALLVDRPLIGKAIAVAMAGTPLALSFGTPAGTLLGTLGGWRVSFGITALVSAVLMAWVMLKLPDFPGMPMGQKEKLSSVLRRKGLRTILLTLAGFVLAHTILYTYIGPLAASLRLEDEVQYILAAFGIAGMASIWFTSMNIARHERGLIIASMSALATGAIILGASFLSPELIYIAAVAWGLGFGGSTTLFTTTASRVGGQSADIAQALVVTVFNLGIGGGGVVGGTILAAVGVHALPWAALALMVPTVLATLLCTTYAFPKALD